MSPVVSVCIPAYLPPAILHRTLASVVAQDLTDVEVIVTDDSPDDAVAKMVAAFAGQLRIDYSRNSTPLGSPGNWNAAISRATAPYIKVLHHDDWFTAPDSLRRFVRLLDENPSAVLAFGASRHCDPAGNCHGHHVPTAEHVHRIAARPVDLYARNFIGAPSAVIFRNGSGVIFDTALRWLVDVDFYIRLLSASDAGLHRIAWTPDELVCIMRESPNRVTADCEGNPAVLAFEGAYLYDKLVRLGLAGMPERWAILSTLRKLGNPSAKQLKLYGVPANLARSLTRAARWSAFRRGVKRWVKPPR